MAAVSNAGGLGIVEGARLTPDQLLQTILKTKRLSTKPYDVNLQLTALEETTADVNRVAVQQLLDTNFRLKNGH